MKLAIVCNQDTKELLLRKNFPEVVTVYFANDIKLIPSDADAVFDLLFENSAERLQALEQFLPKPVFINAVIDTCSEIGKPFIRINGWNSFLKNDILEIVSPPGKAAAADIIFSQLNWRFRMVPDVPGMVTPRIIAMIINEAYHTYGEGISSKEDIDIAMKSGTNYPYGPFEWGSKIGMNNVYNLLVTLKKNDERYVIAPALIKEATEN